jgi:hypothetical protein
MPGARMDVSSPTARSGEGEKLISGEEVLGIWSMCVTETDKFFPCSARSGRTAIRAGGLASLIRYGGPVNENKKPAPVALISENTTGELKRASFREGCGLASLIR